MKLRNIFIAGMSALAFSACSDYLDVDAPSKNDPGYVASEEVELNRALNGVYTALLSDNTYGNKVFTCYTLNSDVDYMVNSTNTNTTNRYYRYDCDPTGGDLRSTWATYYEGIELANLFIEMVENSPLYTEDNADVVQMMGEAKCLRAIYYHDLIWMFGDVPFSFNSSNTATSLIYPIKDRNEIIDALIADIEPLAPLMKTTAEVTVEHCSQELAYGLIARMALTAAGYQLRPDGATAGKMVRVNDTKRDEYLKLVRKYTNEVIEANSHHLNLDFYKVFVDECNFILHNDDDPIFEIPFGKEDSGNIGYVHGPAVANFDDVTIHNYGAASGSARVNTFYGYMFDEQDMRRDYINQLFYYKHDASKYFTEPTMGYNIYNGKWSKLWVNGGLGATTTSHTGINFPYLRYTDILLMFAEADNELNGPTAEAKAALEQVRERAFRHTAPEKAYVYNANSREEFRTTILDERKFEFAGENMRWKDLVRHDLLSENVFWNFWRYWAKGEDVNFGSQYTAWCSLHDFGVDDRYNDVPENYYTVKTVNNADADGNPFVPFWAFPNSELKICRVLNPYHFMDEKEKNALGIKDVISDLYFNNWADGEQNIRNEIHYANYGYIYADQNDRFWIFDPANPKVHKRLTFEPADVYAAGENFRDILPVVRYILPIPQSVINRSAGKYVNQYGY